MRFDLDKWMADSMSLLDEFPYAIVNADRALGDEIPGDVDLSNIGAEISMYLGWAIDSKLVSEKLEVGYKSQLKQFRARKINSRELLRACCSDKLEISCLSERGNDFTRCYLRPGWDYFYYADLDELFPGLSDFAYLEDTWKNYDAAREMINSRFKAWEKPKDGGAGQRRKIRNKKPISGH